MSHFRFQFVIASLTAASACLAFANLATAQPPKRSRQASALKSSPQVNGRQAWPTDWLKRTDGRRLEGIFLSEDATDVEFAEFIRPPGRPLFVVIRTLPRKNIVASEKLLGPQRAELLGRYERLKTRAKIELGRMDRVRLAPVRQPPARFRYQGPWFELLSTADEETTRRCVVRVEQVVRAYRQWLPPQRQPDQRMRLLLIGSLEEYRTYLRQRGWDIRNPAFYIPRLNLIVAGSDISRYATRLTEARLEARQLLTKYQKLNTELGEHLKDVQQKLELAGFDDQQIKTELSLRRKSWNAEMARVENEVTRVNRQNEARFSLVTNKMFARLYHEAFHGYVENYVLDSKDLVLPHWLNEGLAQIFESGQLDDDTLRIDGMNPAALAQIRRDAKANRLMPLSQILKSDSNSFLEQHASSASTRSYAYSWALTRWLITDHGLLQNDQWLTLTKTKNSEQTIRQLERLTKTPLGELQNKWHNAIVQWK